MQWLTSSNVKMMVGTITLNKTTISCVVVAIILVYGLYVTFFLRSKEQLQPVVGIDRDKLDNVKVDTRVDIQQQSGLDINKITEWKSKTIVEVPPEMILTEEEKSGKIKLVEEVLQVDDMKIFYRYGGYDLPSVKGNVLLLHGMKFQSSTWTEAPVWTMQQLVKFGYKVIALDLPGYGNSKQADLKGGYVDFMLKIIRMLDFKHPVIVSPSMSGLFSLPLIMNDSTAVRGFVPVAPVGTDSYEATLYKKILVPTLIVYGEKDTSLGQTSLKHLKALPNSRDFQLDAAGHPAYLDQPARFHQLLYNFLINIPEDWSTS